MSEHDNAFTTGGTSSDDARDHRIRSLPILVLFPHNRCNCRCLMCDIWKIRQVREITVEDLKPHLDSLRELRVRWIVFSGGEPLMHSDLPSLARMCKDEGIRLTLLTAGLLLERQAENVSRWMDDVIVSIDGPPGVHDAVRCVPGAFPRLSAGVRELRRLRPQMSIHGRCTVQKSNFRYLRDTVRAAHTLGLNSISFLAADTTSEAFNRPRGWSPDRQESIALNASEVGGLELEISALISDCQWEIESGFISETPDKLRRIALYYRASLGHTQHISPRCNAPWVSAVIEADGTVRPCFFHHPIGNIREASLRDVLNGKPAMQFRRELDVAKNPICQKCVCSLYLAGEEHAP